ncbi:hypothetical protein ACPA54_13600 [Uniformispora flossi]|uniref:hypothetical protein n=1 Tax=Uniformispora flossi TaxID=3390723 RepID=UPI003C2FE5ED
MSTGNGGTGKPRRSGMAGRLGRGRPAKPALPTPSPAPRRAGWKPKGSPQSPVSGGGRATPGAPVRRTPPSRTNGPRTGRPDPAGGPVPGSTTAKPKERRRIPRQFLPGGAARDDAAPGADEPGGPTPDRNTRPEPPGSGGGWQWSGGGYTAVDYFMLIPGAAVAWYGGRLVEQCAAEASGRTAFFLWLMIAFWVTVATARWPAFRMLRWAWVLAGVLGAVWTPGR